MQDRHVMPRHARSTVTAKLMGVLLRPRAGAILGVAAVVVATLLYFAPTLLHGPFLGSQDILGVFGLGAVPGTVPHNPVSSDQIEEMMPWAALSWTDVHHGHLPLWNPYSGFGMPLLFNFVSASLSLPMLISYLGPLNLTYTVETIFKLVIAGTGVLWMCRRLGLRYPPSILAAVSFTLCGSMTGWSGWPMSGTMAWLGWVIGNVLLIIRTPDRRTLHVMGLAVSLAFVVYAGHPETLLIVVLCGLLMAAMAMMKRWAASRSVADLARPATALLAGGIGALALSAPLLLPGLQIVSKAARASDIGYHLPAHAAVNLAFASYGGLPEHGSVYFGPVNYYETAAYVGIAVLVLAVMALMLRGRDATVLGLVVVGAVCVALTYSGEVSRLLDSIPVVKTVQWTRAVIALDFVLCVLAGFGLDALLERRRERMARSSFFVLSVMAAVALGALWLHHTRIDLTHQERHIQAQSFVWPSIQVLALLAASVTLLWESRSGHRSLRRAHASGQLARAGLALVGVTQAVFLLTATPHIWSSSTAFFPVTTAERTLQAQVGSSRIGFAQCGSVLALPDLGILTEANDAYHVSQTTAYDGTVPRSWFNAYYHEVGQAVPANTGFGQYCPSMVDARVARHFGVGYVLDRVGSPPPPGMVLAMTIAGEELYRVPGGGLVTLQADGTPQDSASATIVREGGRDPQRMSLDTVAPEASTLYIHVTDYPGWSGSIDGRALQVHPWGGTMLSASVPAGAHRIVLTYEPGGFQLGEVLAVVAALSLSGAVVMEWRRSRRREADLLHQRDAQGAAPGPPGAPTA